MNNDMRFGKVWAFVMLREAATMVYKREMGSSGLGVNRAYERAYRTLGMAERDALRGPSIMSYKSEES